MKDTNSVNKGLYCVPPMPIIAQFTNLFESWLVLIVPLLFLILLVHLFRNKFDKKDLLDKRTKSYGLWIITIIAFILIFPHFKAYRELYVINLLILSSLVGLNLFLGKKYSLFKVRKIYWFLFIIFLSGVLVISGLNFHDAYQQWQADKVTKRKFTKVLREIPEPSKEKVQKKTWKGARTLSYKVTVDNKEELSNFYRNNIRDTVCEKFEKEEFNSIDAINFYCKESSYNKWLRLSFDPSNKITIFTITYYKNKPCLPSEDCFSIRNPLEPQTCGSPSLY